ncbi:MAG: hypothetical protein A4E62_00205 [Syntrophorhabdus sp. PtaU1.Bin002]|nr:MAG: hypothetical protein A4E58_02804 [Syntrophorhabdus sp. PtaB.Bin006]OPY73937.1 MAG: hypothetical protein A4E62_00205 [Syntrophorhabdus sp. PtaU1.Bin002]
MQILKHDEPSARNGEIDSPGLALGILCRLVSPVGIQRASASRGGGSDGFAGRVPTQWVAETRAPLTVCRATPPSLPGTTLAESGRICER